jgi:hypothetical protein
MIPLSPTEAIEAQRLASADRLNARVARQRLLASGEATAEAIAEADARLELRELIYRQSIQDCRAAFNPWRAPVCL